MGKSYPKVVRQKMGKKLVGVICGFGVFIGFIGGVVVLSVCSPRSEEYSVGLIVDAYGVVDEEVHSQNPLEASAGVKVNVYYCYREV